MSTSGSRDAEQSDFKKDMFEILDTMTREMRARFENQKPEQLACSTLMPTGKHLMEYEVMAPLAARYEILGINCDMLKGQVTVVKAMLTKEASLRWGAENARLENAGLELSAANCRTGIIGNRKRMERHVWHNLVFL